MRKVSLMLLLLLATLFAGQAVTSVTAQEAAPTAEAAAPEEDAATSNVRFFRDLNETSNATVGQAYRLAHILYAQRMNDEEGSKARKSTTWYREQLLNAGVIDSTWTSDGSRLLSHIGFASLCIKAAKVDGGVMWTLTEMQRYAHREMVDRGLFPRVNPRQYMSGPQALSAYRECRAFIEQAERALESAEIVDAPSEAGTEPEEAPVE